MTWLFVLYQLYASLTGTSGLSFPTDTIWFSLFQHRLAAYAFLRVKLMSAPLRSATTGNPVIDYSELTASSEYYRKAQSAVAAFLRDGL